jgi:hypothetical protein
MTVPKTMVRKVQMRVNYLTPRNKYVDFWRRLQANQAPARLACVP